MTYNILNLPASYTAKAISYVYDATGRKLRRINGSAITEYMDGIEYDSGVLNFIQTEEGRALPNGTTSYNYEYNLKDHLGNSRITFDTPNNTARVKQDDDYYPFGLDVKYSSIPNPENKFLYNGKEIQDNLGQYDYSARFYDPVIGRWTTTDPLAEKGRGWSPYGYVFDNPMRFIDQDGRWGDVYNQQGTHVGNDGINDNKAYIVKTKDNTQLTHEQALNYTTTAGTTSFVEQLGVSNSDLVKLAGVAYAESDARRPNHDETYGIASASVNNYDARQAVLEVMISHLQLC